MAFVLTPMPPIADWLEEFDEFAKRSPGFFVGRPVVVDISQMPAQRPDLVHMVTELKRRNITIMGLDGREPGELGADARGLPPILSGGKDIKEVAQAAEAIAKGGTAPTEGETADTETLTPRDLSEADAHNGDTATAGATPDDEDKVETSAEAIAEAGEADTGGHEGARNVSAVALEAVEKAMEEPLPPPTSDTMIVTEPVRSGQSIVHMAGDVTVIGSVASGSEIVASGSIHIYGTLRGRAVAGAGGNRNARIFTQSLQAELIAIDGLYKTAEDIAGTCRGGAAQAWLDGDSLKLAAF